MQKLLQVGCVCQWVHYRCMLMTMICGIVVRSVLFTDAKQAELRFWLLLYVHCGSSCIHSRYKFSLFRCETHAHSFHLAYGIPSLLLVEWNFPIDASQDRRSIIITSHKVSADCSNEMWMLEHLSSLRDAPVSNLLLESMCGWQKIVASEG